MLSLGVHRKPDYFLAIWPCSSSKYYKCLFLQDHQEFDLSNLGLIHWTIWVLKNFRFCTSNEKYTIVIYLSKVWCLFVISLVLLFIICLKFMAISTFRTSSTGRELQNANQDIADIISIAIITVKAVSYWI